MAITVAAAGALIAVPARISAAENCPFTMTASGLLAASAVERYAYTDRQSTARAMMTRICAVIRRRIRRLVRFAVFIALQAYPLYF
jgi:hypothetical protein